MENLVTPVVIEKCSMYVDRHSCRLPACVAVVVATAGVRCRLKASCDVKEQLDNVITYIKTDVVEGHNAHLATSSL